MLTPTRFERDDLLDDPRFWALLYEHWVKPRVGDGFEDGERYFFSVRETAVNAFFQKLKKARTPRGSYPEHSVLITLRNGWRIGVVLSLYPEDFAVQDVIEPPTSEERIVFGVNGGNSRLPALRWEELLVLSDAVVPDDPAVRAKAMLLLFPAIFLSSKHKFDRLRQTMGQAWQTSGIPVNHADELVGRPIDDFLGIRKLYPKLGETIWSRHRKHGWINEGHHSLRNPKVEGSERVIPRMRELFATLT
jgi:hypothetical protein